MRAISLLILALVTPAWGHIGSPNVYFEGNAGPYPVRVTIRPPGVIPGLADIDVRVLRGHAQRVTALPVFWDVGRKGAPPPDEAEPVRGATNLFHTTLWLMKAGAYSVNVSVRGPIGEGSAVVPVNSVATSRNQMPPWFGAMFAALGLLLFGGAVRLVGAAFGESVLPPGEEMPGRLRRRSRLAMGGAVGIFALLLAGGRAWWNLEDRNYRNNRLYKPVPATASIQFEKEQPFLRLTVGPASNRNHSGPLMPDHGKLMHLFLVREPGLDAFAHLHPVPRRLNVFEAMIPPLPSGSYQIYADVTHENGFSETLTAKVSVPTLPNAVGQPPTSAAGRDVICSSTYRFIMQTNATLSPDPDDSWHMGSAILDSAPATNKRVSHLADGFSMVWESGGALVEGREAPLRFRLVSPSGGLAILEPYMGMLGHAAVRRDDGAVFTHLHPSGTFSMASQHFFLHREKGTNELGVVSGNEATPLIPHPIAGLDTEAASDAVSFPYEFPKAGAYHIWVQLKSGGRVFTGVFEQTVAAAR